MLAAAPDSASRLARAIASDAASHPGLSGIYALPDGRGAFATRALLIEAAERTLDVQYYIWDDDLSGALLLDALRRAAGRGVRVRLLLDDNGIDGLDPILGALDAQANVEVRLYNPFRHRGLRLLGYLTEFRRLNRRMHNKSLTADAVATVVGGRNVGDEYFGAGEEVNFADLDLLAVGHAVQEVSASFEQYWASPSAVPIARVVGGAPRDAGALLAARLEALGGEPGVREYLAALDSSSVVRDALAGSLPFEWVEARVMADDPAKTLASPARGEERRLLPMLAALVGATTRRLDIVSPYFVPMKGGVAALTELARNGVEVRVLTNSAAATDVLPVHAGYAKRRRALLEAGVRLFELRATAPRDARAAGWVSVLGSSGASLHAKTFAMDGDRAFVGSFNFDPRSIELNTEMGVVVRSTGLAGAIHDVFESAVPRIAYEVRLGEDGALQWVEHTDSGERTHATEPDIRPWIRAALRVLSWLPIDHLL